MRAAGYYWVKFKHDFEEEATWTVGKYCFDDAGKGQWLLPVESGWYERDDDFDEIDENRIERIPMTIPKEWNKITPNK